MLTLENIKQSQVIQAHYIGPKSAFQSYNNSCLRKTEKKDRKIFSKEEKLNIHSMPARLRKLSFFSNIFNFSTKKVHFSVFSNRYIICPVLSIIGRANQYIIGIIISNESHPQFTFKNGQ